MTTVVWFRLDLRRQDNAALAAAAGAGPIVPLYILDDVNPGPWKLGGASRWWLHHSLEALHTDLGGLVLLRGDPRDVLPKFAARVSATHVFWNRCYESFAIARDHEIKTTLQNSGIDAQSFNGSLLFEPWEVATGTKEPFKVYTPFWRSCTSRSIASPVTTPPFKVKAVDEGDRLDDWELLPQRPNWAAGWDKMWQPGEKGAINRLETFIARELAEYRTLRDRPDRHNVSRLSPHLHFGEISPRTVWAKVSRHSDDASRRQDVVKFLSELGWREFAYHLLYHFPSLPERNWRSSFDAYPWHDDKAHLTAWQRGQTGFPLVDAGMRALWRTGWMHNRVRMVAASFLVKHLRIDWRRGEAWFWDTLLDADLANNAAGWQWVAGSGADASPYFRIFNPILQGRTFDPNGDYIRRWCPELAHLPTRFIHAPFEASPEILERAGVRLGETYPKPIVDHEKARRAALEGYQHVRAVGL
jgi:deoxyribodipyrimidine photo-lyase